MYVCVYMHQDIDRLSMIFGDWNLPKCPLVGNK